MKCGHKLPLSLLAVVVAGCAEQPPKFEPVDYERLTSIHVVAEGRFQTTRFRSTRLAGAGLNQQGYFHVLHTAALNDGKTQKKLVFGETVGAEKISGGRRSQESEGNATPLASLVTTSNRDGASAPDAARRAWQRFCNAGEGMTEDDWIIVGNQPVPEEFLGRCLPPK